MAQAEDDDALDAIWSMLGAEVARPRGFDRKKHVKVLVELARSSCLGKGEIYAAERKAIGELALALGLDPEHYPAIDDLEDEIADELLRRLRERLEAMDEEELREQVAKMLKRMSDEQRVRLMEQILMGIDDMEPEEREAFIRKLAEELEVEEEAILHALEGGAAALLPLLIARASGFTVYLLSTKLLYLAFTRGGGVVLPFVVYQMKNRALSWFLGPWGMILTTGLSAAWFGVRKWRRQERVRKLAQLVTYSSFWRRRSESNPLAGVLAS
jgi:hypothetical protein